MSYQNTLSQSVFDQFVDDSGSSFDGLYGEPQVRERREQRPDPVLYEKASLEQYVMFLLQAVSFLKKIVWVLVTVIVLLGFAVVKQYLP